MHLPKIKVLKVWKVGHIAKVYRSKARPQRSTAATPPQPQHLHVDKHSSDSEPDVTIELNKPKLQIEIDTEASRSIVGESNYGLKNSVQL